MEKTTSRSSSSRSCSRNRASHFGAALLALALCAGCVSYQRVVPHGAAKPLPDPSGTDPRFRVVDCILETHKTFAVVVGERGGSSTQSVQRVQAGLAEAAPGWFSDDVSALPIVVKIRATVTSTYSGDAWLKSLVFLPSLGLIPVKTGGVFFDMDVFLQLGPGEWSEAYRTIAQVENLDANVLTATMFPSMYKPEEGWQKESEKYAEPNGGIVTPWGQFTLMPYLKGGTGADGMNPCFAKMLATGIAGAWNGLSPGEKRRAMRNPVAIRMFREQHPEMEAGPSDTGFAVPSPGSAEAAAAAVGKPSVVNYSYLETSRRGFVVFRANGTEHLAALRWVRTKIIPAIAGQGATIRIVSEKTLENGDSRIDFEVVQ